MKVFLDQDACIGCGLCPDICPEVFEMIADEDVARAKVESVPPAAEDGVREAADSCPVDAICFDE